MAYFPGSYMPPLDGRLYTCIAELTGGQRRWFAQHDAVRARLKHYERIKIMKTTVIDGDTGVAMAGPDSPALAAAQARDTGGVALAHDTRTEEQRSNEYLAYGDHCREVGDQPLAYAVWADRTRCSGLATGPERMRGGKVLLGASAGRVSAEQAGILPTGGIAISEEMVRRGREASRQIMGDHGLDAPLVRAILEAALHG